MKYTNYKMIKTYGGQSIGMFGNDIYAYEVLTGICDVPGYYQITKHEYNTFDEWKDESTGELGTMYEIHNRKPLCSGYKDSTEIKNVAKEFVCPICGKDFLVEGGIVPNHIDIKQICPDCNKKPEPKMDLMFEIKKQLHRVEIRIRNLGSLFTSYYIDPYSKLDMRGYVSVGSTSYYLRVNERGKLIIEYHVIDKRKAAYWILRELLYSMEYDLLSKEEKYDIHTDEVIKEKCRDHFKKMELNYTEWYEKNIGIFNFDKIL